VFAGPVLPYRAQALARLDLALDPVAAYAAPPPTDTSTPIVEITQN
jgi:hypothetical protein